MPEHDLVIVGGGPGGAAAAITAASRGLAVVLCEREEIFQERPGETLHPGLVPLLGQLGLTERLAPLIHARHAGIWVEWGGKRGFTEFGGDGRGPWEGFHVRRADFDTLLLARAREAGVEVRRSSAVTGVLADIGAAGGGAVRGVLTDRGPLAARLVVDASGRARWLARALGIASPPRSPRFIARYGYAEGSCPARDAAPLLRGDPTGWTWTARVWERTYQWTRLSFDARPERDWLPEEFRGLAPLTRSRGADVTWRIAERTSGPGWFMVGDAAAALDPTSAHGVLKAIMSGIAAGDLAAGVLAGRLPAEASAAAYHEWLEGWFVQDRAELTRHYRRLRPSLFA
ncbi:MAG TPA: FAD-dependent monooxygenase [Acetobacteraceae bacterium]|nr:FAD-dependent monooxygenase [Acetobacteraceae bacterium]